MKKIAILNILISLVLLGSCNKDEELKDVSKFEYHAHIISPTVANKYMGNSLSIEVNFESHTGEPVYNIDVRIVEKDGGKVIYDMPSDTQVNEESGSYRYLDNILLDTKMGFKGDTDYLVIAKIWGNEPGLEETIEEIEFHVHPKP